MDNPGISIDIHGKLDIHGLSRGGGEDRKFGEGVEGVGGQQFEIFQ